MWYLIRCQRERFAMKSALKLVLLCSVLLSAHSAARAQAEDRLTAEKEEVIKLAKKFSERYEQTKSLEPLIGEFFTPPFNRTPLDPGYIKGYPPGIRENGGQYTHAALWSVMAFAALGQGDVAAVGALLETWDERLPRYDRVNSARLVGDLRRGRPCESGSMIGQHVHEACGQRTYAVGAVDGDRC